MQIFVSLQQINLDFFTFQLSEIAQGVWCFAVKVKALINSVPVKCWTYFIQKTFSQENVW